MKPNFQGSLERKRKNKFCDIDEGCETICEWYGDWGLPHRDLAGRLLADVKVYMYTNFFKISSDSR